MITNEAQRMKIGSEVMAIEAAVDQAIAQLQAFHSQLDAIKTAMKDAIYTADDKAEIDRIKTKITDALA
jgi:hypothetical protein